MTIFFSTFNVSKQVFYKTQYSYALVNLKPIVPGHILIVPLRKVPRLSELTIEETNDFFQTVKFISSKIEKIYSCDSLNIAIQDGIAAGQSVPHLHCHIIPRYLKDGYGDGIYNLLQESEGYMLRNMNNWWKEVCEPMETDDSKRHERTMEVMENEAKWLSDEIIKE